eukprot:TRINITY_DN78110_c0_g1_i1.p1 TRINITY_DN78110_c0_g1~~TRINITY_DN78110_c0_g1_i1.p1  ORF type:complete len:852 (-),score=243.95 TRINITY_DN78110_c0_g1_i1:59-2527(-)
MAAELLEQAEKLLLAEEDHQKAKELSEEALRLAREAGDQRSVADGLRQLTSCEQTRAQDLRFKDSSQQKSIWSAAEKRVAAELSLFRETGERYGEAMMLMVLADLIFEGKRIPESRRGNKKRQEVMEKANKALQIFKTLGEKKFEAYSLCVVSTGSLCQNEPDKALASAEEAVETFRALGDRLGEAKALHTCSVAVAGGSMTRSSYEKGIQFDEEAATIYAQLGLQRMLAWQNNCIAKWYLSFDKPRNALSFAKESLRILRELRYGKGWQPEACGNLCRAMLGVADVKGAFRLAEECLQQFEGQGDLHGQILSLENLVDLHMESDNLYERGDMNEALLSAERAVALCKQLGDRKWEASALSRAAQANLRLGQVEEALKAVTESSALLDDLGEQALRSSVLQTAIEVLMAKGDVRAALEVASEVRRIAKDLGKRSNEAYAMLLQAQLHHASGQFETALSTVEEAQIIFQQVKDKKGEGSCWSVIADVRKSMGEKAEALRAARTTQVLYQQAGDKKSQAYAMKASTSLFVATASDQEAVRSANEALAVARASGELKAEVEMLNLVAQATLNAIIKTSQGMEDADAVMYITQHEAQATKHAREAAAMARKLGDKQMTGIATYSLAQCHAVAGRTAAACQAAFECRELLRQTWDRQGEAMAVLMQSESAVLNGQMQQGREWAKEAIEMFKALNDTDGAQKATQTLEQIEEFAGALGGGRGYPAKAEEHRGPEETVVSAAPVQKKPALSPEKARDLAKKVALEAIGGDEDVTLDDALMDIGLDSLAAIAFREQLSHNSGIPLPSTLIFDYPSLSAVADHLVESSQEM